MRYFIALFTIILMTNGSAFAQGHEGHNHPVNDGKITTPELLTQSLKGDIIYGDHSSPVTIVEYASLSCGHCASFYKNILSKLKDDYISKGKVKLIYRHYPLNAPALQAAMMVECTSDNATKKKLLSRLFSSQKEWAFTNNFNSRLREIAKEFKIKGDEFDACIDDTEKQNSILELQLKAQKGLSVRSTPTLFINGELYRGRGYEAFSKHIDELLKSTKE